MNFATSWQRLLSLLAVAFCVSVSSPVFGCDVVVTGGQPVIVNIYLDPMTGLSSLSGANIAAFVQGTGPGCNVYQFYSSPDKADYIGTEVQFTCADVSPDPVFYVVRMDDDPNFPDSGNESNPVTISVVVHDNTVPTVTCPGNKTYTTAQDGNQNCLFRAQNGVTVAANELKLTWADNCGLPEYNFNGGAWASGDNVAVPFHNFAKGVTTVNYRVQDATHSASCSFTVTVNDVTPPILNNTQVNINVNGNQPFANILAVYANNLSGVTAVDSCDGPRPITYSIDPDTLMTCPNTFKITRKWVASDLSGNSVMATQVVSIIDNFAPVVAPYPADTTIFTEIDDADCDAYFEIDPLSFSVDCSPTSALSVEYWVDNVLVPSLDGDYSADFSPYSMVFIVEDQCGNADTTEFNLYVEDVTPPIAICQTSLNLVLNNAGVLDISTFPDILDQGSFDNCSAVGFSVFPSLFDCSHVGTPQSVTLYVNDVVGNTSTCLSTVNVQDNTAPVLTCPADRTFSCAIDETLAGFATATDACGVAGVTMESANFGQTGPHCFTQIRIFTATDLNGNQGYCQQNLLVEDNFAPVLLNVPADTIVDCGTVLIDPIVTAFDTCDGSHFVTPSLQIFPGSQCDVDKIKTIQVRTWEATDSCGNYAVTQDTVKFLDLVAPDISGVPSDLNFFVDINDCDALIDIDLADYGITDACGGTVTLSPSTWISTQSVGDYIFGFSAEDECGNVEFGQINVHVIDNSVPTVVCQTDINVSLDNTGLHQFDINELLINASDNCPGSLTYALSQDFATCADASLEALGFGPVVVTVTIADASGNSNTCEVIVHTIAPPDIAIDITNFNTTDPTYLGANDGSVEILSVAGGSGNFDYAILDGVTGALISPTFSNDTLTAGFYFLGVQDQVTSCIDIQDVFLNDGPLPLIVADTISGPSGDTICLPVTVAHFQNIVSVQMDFSIPDATVGQVLSVENFQSANFDLAATNPISNDFTVSMINPLTNQVDLVDGDTLFCINIELVGGLFDTTSVTIIDGSVELVTGTPGNFTNLDSDNQDGFVAINSGLPDANIAGEIRAWWGQTVALADVDLNGGQASQTTAADGLFAFQVNVGDPCELTPSKDINYVNGVSVFDLFTIQRHILGDPAALGGDPYKIIAADANGDDEVTTFDLVELQSLVLNLNSDISTNTSWRFVPANWAFLTANDPWTPAFPESIDLGIVLADSLQNDFVAIKIGDIDGDADPLTLVSTDDRAPMLFEINDREISAGEVIAMPILARGFDARLGWQMTLDFDTQLFDYQGFATGELTGISENNFGKKSVSEGKLTTVWFAANPVSMNDGAVLFTLYFKTKKGAASIENSLRISSEITPAIGLDGAKNRTMPQIVWSKNSKNAPADMAFELSQNLPNPFSNETIIGFTLPEATDATFNIFDAAGKLVRTTTANFEQGRNEIRLDRSDFSASGVYFYEIKTSTESARKRMILVD